MGRVPPKPSEILVRAYQQRCPIVYQKDGTTLDIHHISWAESSVYVIPLKSGLWRAVRMSVKRHQRWRASWRRWWARVGNRLARSPEMWK